MLLLGVFRVVSRVLLCYCLSVLGVLPGCCYVIARVFRVIVTVLPGVLNLIVSVNV